MLAGVGGRTVAEAKAVMSYAEAQQWAAYIREHGSVNPLRRMEQWVAKLCYVTAKVQGAKVQFEDFLPGKPEEVQEGTIQDVFALLQSMAKKK
ncbi:hypothetical protein FQZ97_1036300 [compost metagenome]